MNAREAIAEVLRGVGFWGTHSDRWNDTEWQDRYWLTLADALLASDVLGRVRDEAVRGITLADVPTCDYPRCIALAGHAAGHVLANSPTGPREDRL